MTEKVKALCTDGMFRTAKVRPDKLTGVINGQRATIRIDGKRISGCMIVDREIFRFKQDEGITILPDEFKE